MTDAISAAQMREFEREAMASGRVTGLELMERAGQGVVAAIFDHWPDLVRSDPHRSQRSRACVLCGPGNNGGDGFVIARLLSDAGVEVDVMFWGDAQRLPPDARHNHDRWCAIGAVTPLTLRQVKQAADADVYVDAVFGIGLSRPVTGALGDVLRHLAGYGGDRDFYQPRLVAVDVPSGLDADTGMVPGKGAQDCAPACPFCALTVTFHRIKPGHVQSDGPAHCGALIVADIGL